MQGSPDAKKPCKGILKTSSSFDKHSGSSCNRKSAKFDEFNVLQTYHPPDKDYGHMKIDEPKTPYNYSDPGDGSHDQLDAELLAEKLKFAAGSRMSSNDSSSSSDDDETEEQRLKRIEFEKRRKAHYREFEAVKIARKLIEEEVDEDEEDDKIPIESKQEISDSEKEESEENCNLDTQNMNLQEFVMELSQHKQP